MTTLEILAALWTLVSSGITVWLAKRFATREDLQRVEGKLDTLLALTWRNTNGSPELTKAKIE